MAEHASNNINYYLVLDKSFKDNLGAIRNWTNLKIAYEGNNIWLKDFDFAQINSLEVKSIPCKTIYYSKNAKLFLQNSNLPDRNIPSLLWTAVDRGLPVKLPSFNHNYFGIEQKVSVKIIRSDVEREGTIMITELKSLKKYIEKAPSVRLQKISWAIINNEKAILFGIPLLPMPGDVYWAKNELVFPTGYDLELHLLSATINEKLNPDKNSMVIFEPDSSYYLIEKQKMKTLSLGSFRMSTEIASKSFCHGI